MRLARGLPHCLNGNTMTDRPALKIADIEDVPGEKPDGEKPDAEAKPAAKKPGGPPAKAKGPGPAQKGDAAKPAPKKKPAPKPKPAATRVSAPATAPLRKRHGLIIASFLFFVLAPAALAIYYLFFMAVDQYHSRTAFSIRSEEVQNPLEALSAFTQTGQGSASDIDILYDFIRSQPLVERLDAELDLRSMFRRHPADFVFSLSEDPPIEDLMEYWRWMVSVAVDNSTGVVDVEVRAFTAEDAVSITKAILRESSDLVNELSQIAQDDKTRFATANLEQAQERLKSIRLELSEFRSRYQIIDPEADVEGQMNVVGALQVQLADALVSRETLKSYARENDPRLLEIDRRISAIRTQIEEERERIASNTEQADGRTLTEVFGKYEELLVDLEFSQDAYVSARALEEQSLAEAQRQSRFLAAHIEPTRSVEPQYPQRPQLALIIVAGLFAAWGVIVLIYYNVRDRT